MLFGAGVFVAVLVVSHGPAPRHHPLADIHPIHGTLGNDPPIAVTVKFLAAYRATAGKRLQGAGGVLPAPPALSIPAAKLASLGRVDSMKADTVAGNFQSVAVDDPSPPGYISLGRPRQNP